MLSRDFMMCPENNRFGYEYQVDQQSDMTPLRENILELVNHHGGGVRNRCMYTNNQDIASDYFADNP
jgi:hypothetical protein